MKDLRNPFRLQTAESIEVDADFLRLFGPGVLDLLSEETLWSLPQFIRSAPGGGKTSLLKLFTPSVLLTLIALRASGDYKELFQRMRQLGVLDENELRVIGVMLPCGRTFPDLADLELPAPRARRLLMTLLDARIMLASLRGALVAKRLRYPDDLSRVSLAADPSQQPPPGLPLPCDGDRARAWAEDLERTVCDVIDSLTAPESPGPVGHDGLLTLGLLDRDAIRIDGTPVGARWLVLLDDVHKLTVEQRLALRETVVEQRSRAGVWLAERLEALSPNELLSPGALEGRDYDVVNLEEAWRKDPRRFDAAVRNIAERRAHVAADVSGGVFPIGSFAATIQESLDGSDTVERMQKATRAIQDRVHIAYGSDPKYVEWIRAKEEQDGPPRERLIAWRTLEILIERQKRKKQMAFDFALTREELDEKDDSGVRAAAELFVAKEFGFPYYFGPARLSSLGSYNVEQYLRLAGDLFEEALAMAVMKRPAVLPPERQERILDGSYDARVKDLPRRAKHGRDVLNFLDAVGAFCRDVTYQPNAPYAPGVNGIAISMQDRKLLIEADSLKGNALYARFARMLATALAHNLLHAELDRSVKGGRYMVLYLNRLLCLKYDLPLSFGGYREKPLREFLEWLERGYRSSRSETLKA